MKGYAKAAKSIATNIALGAVSVYLVAVIVQAPLEARYGPNATRPPVGNAADVAENGGCPPDEWRSFHSFESMGPRLRRHPDFGWILNPSTRSVNAKGGLGPCVRYDKASGTLRVVLLGDSFTGAIQVPYAQTFASRILDRLSQSTGQPVEVVNLGVGGYGNDQQYDALIREASRYEPDLVVQSIFLGNDVRDNSFTLSSENAWPHHRAHPNKGFYSVDAAGQLLRMPPDLDYYYQLNLAGTHFRYRWIDEIQGLGLDFEYDANKSDGAEGKGLAGVLFELPSKTPIGRLEQIRFGSPGELFSLDFGVAGSLDVTWLTNAWMIGNLGASRERVRFRKEDSQEELRASLAEALGEPVPAGWTIWRYLLLDPLRSTLPHLLGRNLRLSAQLVRWGILEEVDLPFRQLLAFQHGYPLDYDRFLVDSPGAWNEAWALTERLIAATRDHVEDELGARYVVGLIPSMESKYPWVWDLVERAYPALVERTDEMDLRLPRRRAGAMLERLELNYVDLGDTIDRLFRDDVLYDIQHQHFNRRGHEVYADLLVDAMLRELDDR